MLCTKRESEKTEGEQQNIKQGLEKKKLRNIKINEEKEGRGQGVMPLLSASATTTLHSRERNSIQVFGNERVGFSKKFSALLLLPSLLFLPSPSLFHSSLFLAFFRRFSFSTHYTRGTKLLASIFPRAPVRGLCICFI